MVSIVTTGETTKTGVVSKQLLPDVAVLDAELTVGLPPHITAATGIDAMVHAIEAFTSRHQKNAYSDMLAREALRLMSSNISEAVHNGSHLEARSNMLLGHSYGKDFVYEEYIRANADDIWLKQHGEYEILHERKMERNRIEQGLEPENEDPF